MSGSAGISQVAAHPRHLSAAAMVMLAAQALFWGLNWPAMRITVAEFPPWHYRVLCLGIGGAALLTLAWLRGQRISVPRAEIVPLIAASVIFPVCWHMLTAFGLQLVDAGRGGIIGFTMPLWAAILAGPVLGEKLDARRWLAVAIGIAGLALLVLPAMDRIGASPFGSLMILAASWGWCIGTLIVKKHKWSFPAVSMAGWQLLIATVPIVAGMVVFEPDVSFVATLTEMSRRAWLWFIFTLALPMVFCQFAWFRLVELLPANIASLCMLAVPVVGLVSGWLILDEIVTITDVAAMGLIVVALALVLVVPARRVPAPDSPGAQSARNTA